MKNIYCILITFLFGMQVQAQSFPMPGATWIIKGNPQVPMALADQGGEKLVYVGDSIAPNGVVKLVEYSSTLVNPYYYPNHIVKNIDTIPYFLVNGDIYYSLVDTFFLLGDFSLSVGDSAYTPMRNQINYISWQDDPCAWNELSRKGWVTEVGTNTADGIVSRYYKLKYEDPYGTPFEVTYNERILSMDLAVVPHVIGGQFPTCTSTVISEWTPFYSLFCYYDNAMPLQNHCVSESLWFQNLTTEQWEGGFNLSILPNPTSSDLWIQNENNFSVSGQLIDIQGKQIERQIKISSNSTTKLNLSNLKNGLYFLKFTDENGGIQTHKIIKK